MEAAEGDFRAAAVDFGGDGPFPVDFVFGIGPGDGGFDFEVEVAVGFAALIVDFEIGFGGGWQGDVDAAVEGAEGHGLAGRQLFERGREAAVEAVGNDRPGGVDDGDGAVHGFGVDLAADTFDADLPGVDGLQVDGAVLGNENNEGVVAVVGADGDDVVLLFNVDAAGSVEDLLHAVGGVAGGGIFAGGIDENIPAGMGFHLDTAIDGGHLDKSGAGGVTQGDGDPLSRQGEGEEQEEVAHVRAGLFRASA